MATLTSFFGGSGGGCCSNIETNEWGTLLPTPHTDYVYKTSTVDHVPTACFCCNLQCVKQAGHIPLCDNWFVSLAQQCSCSFGKGYAAKLMCISSDGCACTKSNWCVLCNSNSGCNMGIVNGTSDGCKCVYLGIRIDSNSCFHLHTFRIDYTNCNIICNCCCISGSCHNSNRGMYGSEFAFTGKTGEVRIWAKNNQGCFTRHWKFDSGKPCGCYCDFDLSNQIYCACNYMTIYTPDQWFLAHRFCSACILRALWCQSPTCYFHEMYCVTSCGGATNLLFAPSDSRKFWTELPNCGTDPAPKGYYGFMARGYVVGADAQARNQNQVIYGNVNLMGELSFVYDNASSVGTSSCRCYTDHSFGYGTAFGMPGRFAIQSNGVINYGGVMTSEDNYAWCMLYQCIPNTGTGDDGRSLPMSLGSTQYYLGNDGAVMSAFTPINDRKVNPMFYPTPNTGYLHRPTCVNGLHVIGKCWLLTTYIDKSQTGGTGCTFLCYSVFEMCNRYAS